MTSPAPTAPARRRRLNDAVDDAAIFAHEHQLRMATQIGIGASFELMPELGCAHFIGLRELICPAQVIGVVTGKEWRWGWASKNVTAPRSLMAKQVHQFGVARDMPIFTTDRIGLRTPRDAERLVAASKVIHRWWTSFAFPIDGMIFYAAFAHEAFDLPTPTPAGVAHALRSVEHATPLTNGRRAVRSYAEKRGLGRQERRDRTATRLLLPAGRTVTVQFTEKGKIKNVVTG